MRRAAPVSLPGPRGALFPSHDAGAWRRCPDRKLGADPSGVGVVQVFEDGECLPPGLAGLGQAADGVLSVAEVIEGHRFSPAVAEFPDDAKRALVARSSFGEITQLMLGISQAVPDGRVNVAVPGFGVE